MVFPEVRGTFGRDVISEPARESSAETSLRHTHGTRVRLGILRGGEDRPSITLAVPVER